MFTGFTLSQAGMVVHHWRLREPHWRASAVVNGVGCVATGVVAIVVVVSKFTEGAWIPAVLIPGSSCCSARSAVTTARYRAAVAVDADLHGGRGARNLVVVLVGSVHRGVIDAVQYARSMAPERLIAVSVVTDHDEQEELARQWDADGMPIPLHTIASPYRELTRPILDYLDELARENPTTS